MVEGGGGADDDGEDDDEEEDDDDEDDDVVVGGPPYNGEPIHGLHSNSNKCTYTFPILILYERNK